MGVCGVTVGSFLRPLGIRSIERGSDALVAAGGGCSPNYAVAADGQRFLMIKQSGAFAEGRRPEIKVVLDWFEELNARGPVP